VRILFFAIVFGALAGGLTAFAVLHFSGITGAVTSDNEALIAEFYAVENAVHVSPHSLRKMMDKGDDSYVLVDLRSAEEYEEEHIIGAISIPAYKNKDHSDYGAVDRIVEEFSGLPKDKDILVYCYSVPCMTGRKIGMMLAERGIFVKHLNIGWNEWRHEWTSWNHEHEWDTTDVMDYIASGSEPGIPEVKSTSTACPIDSSLGC
jgi:rhodanese-related sulfurtransferase